MSSIEKYMPRLLIICSVFLGGIVFTSTINCATAQTGTPMKPWDLVEAQLHRNSGLAAAEISSSFEVIGDQVPLTGKYITRVRQWNKNGEISRPLDGSDEASLRAYKMATLDLALATRFADKPDELFQTPDSVAALGETMADGRALSIYQVHARFINGKFPITANIWFDSANGTVVKVEGTAEKVDLPGMRTVNFSLVYRTDSEGRCLPATLRMDYTVSIFFHTGKIAFVQNFYDWVRRPQQ